MTTDTTWMKKMIPSIFETLSLSDHGTIPNFPMEGFITAIKKSLGLESLSIQLEKMGWIDPHFFYTGLGTKTIVIPLSMAPLSGEIFFVMGMEDIKALIGCMEKSDTVKGTITLDNETIIKGLYTYVLTELIDTIMELKVYKDLSIKITDVKIEPIESYGIDLSIDIQGAILPARLLIPNTFYTSIHSYFTFIPPTLENLEGIIDVAIPMSIRTGSVALSIKEMEELEEGDFLIMKNSFYDIEKKKGSFQMLIGTFPLFQVKKQKDGIKILDYLYFYNEENMDDLDDDFSDDFSADFLSTEEDVEEQLPLDEEIEEEEKEEKEEPLNHKIATPEQMNVSQVPITVHIEVARFTLSLEQLKKLAPGMKLPVMINPKQVNLIVSGKSIGKAEVIEIGDTLGVKVTKLYS